MSRLKLSLCGCIGVMLTVLAAAVVFPVRARSRLRKSTAHILEDLGSLAFQLLGEFCQVRAAPLLCSMHKCHFGAGKHMGGPDRNAVQAWAAGRRPRHGRNMCKYESDMV